MSKRNRPSQLKREREQKKRERQRRKAEKSAQKRERKFGKDDDAPSVIDHPPPEHHSVPAAPGG